MTDPDDAVWTYGYTAAGQLTSLADPRASQSLSPQNFTTAFTYNAAGQALSVLLPNGTREFLEPVQANGLAGPGSGTTSNPAPAALMAGAAALYTDPDGQTWTTFLDGLGMGQAIQQVDPLGDTSLTYRDANGLPWLTVNELGQATRTFFDAAGNPTQTGFADNDNAGTRTSYNQFGEPVQVIEPTGATTNNTYDSEGNLLLVENALGNDTHYTYNPAGLVVTTTDALGNTTTFSYDALNRLVGVTDPSPLGYTQAFAYNSAGDLTASTNEDGFTTLYVYNAMGQQIQEMAPVSLGVFAVYTSAYDPAGNQVSASTPLNYVSGILVSATTRYSFDGLNQLLSTTDPTGSLTLSSTTPRATRPGRRTRWESPSPTAMTRPAAW